MPKISIVVPIYNTDQYLHRCIDSILNQTFKDFEVILVDDGSTDNSGKICDEYEIKDSRVRVIHQENQGVAEAQNTGVENSVGEFVGIVNSDDFIEDDMYRILYENALKFSADISICKHNQVSGEAREDYKVTNNTIVFNNEEAFECLFTNKYFASHSWDKLCKRKLFEGVRFPSGKIYEDMFTTYRLFEKADCVVYTDYIGYNYFQREDSILHSDFTDSDLDYIDSYDKIFDVAREKYPNSIDTIKSAYVVANMAILSLAYQSGYKDPKITSEIQQNVRHNVKHVYDKSQVPFRTKAGATIVSLNRDLYYMLIKLKQRLKGTSRV